MKVGIDEQTLSAWFVEAQARLDNSYSFENLYRSSNRRLQLCIEECQRLNKEVEFLRQENQNLDDMLIEEGEKDY